MLAKEGNGEGGWRWNVSTALCLGILRGRLSKDGTNGVTCGCVGGVDANVGVFGRYWLHVVR